MAQIESLMPACTVRKRYRPRKRVLVVNVFIDEYGRTNGSPQRVPRAMGPPYLAGAFSRETCEVRLYNEQYSGALEDLDLLAWPDMLVLTGVTSGFDRMLHLTAYVRTLNEKVVVVAGGPAVRALPRLSARFFDYACVGDIEQLQSVAHEVFGAAYVADEMFPRFDLVNARGPFAYVESSRNCNFRCDFCSLTGEKGKYQTYDLNYVRRQILAAGNRKIVFIDNNFYGNDRRYFSARIDLLGELHRERRIKGWCALVTGDFFRRAENLDLARKSGCFALFSGVESFEPEFLLANNKRQNMLVPQVEMIRDCLEAGILFVYGIMLDPCTRRLEDLRREIEFIVGTPEITLPAFFTLAIPLLGTPHFRDCLEKELFLPNVRLRDLDGVAVAMRPLDPIDEVVSFARDLPSLRGHRRDVVRHALDFLWRYKRTLSPFQLYATIMSAAFISTETFSTSRGRQSFHPGRRTYLAGSGALDPFYTPLIHLATPYRDHFRPTMVTDAAGELSQDIAEDLAAASCSEADPIVRAGVG